MLPFRRILVATDFSEYAGAALGRALALAEESGAAITVAHVVADVASAVPAVSFENHWRIQPADLEKAGRKLRRQAHDRLNEWLAPHRRRTGKLRGDVLIGVPFVELIRAVQRDGHDLLLAGTRGFTGLKRVLVGSTAERLIRKCPCPVWIVKPEHEWPLRSVLAPIDFADVSSKVTDLAVSLAEAAHCPLTLLHAMELPSDEPALLPTVAGWIGDHHERRVLRRAGAAHLQAFVKHCAPNAGTIAQQLAVGKPWQVIRRVAEQLDAGLIVMGSMGRTGVPGFFIGNTAEKVLRTCDRSILTVKPDGFESPVTLGDGPAKE